MPQNTEEKSSRPNELPGLYEQFKHAFQIVFKLDFRSLAVFRIGLGVILLLDLVFRARSLTEMYTDGGFFSRNVAYDYYQATWGDGWNTIFWSVHWLGGSVEFVSALFVIAGFFAVLLIVGKWTRLATIVSWFFLVSLHVRNPVINISADFLLKMMLFWSFFLPLARVWSLDARSAVKKGTVLPKPISGVANFASAGLIIQLVAMYFFTGLAKWNEGWWTGEAMYYCLGLDIYVTPFGRSLLRFPLLLKFASLATVFAEVFLIWTLFLARHNTLYRVLNMTVYWSFHLGIWFSMSIGLFSPICMMAWIPLIPGSFWVWFQKNTDLDRSDWKGTVEEKVPMTWSYRVQQTFCAVMIVFVIAWNVSNIENATIRKYSPRLFAKIGLVMGVNQHFQMFGEPPRSNPWFVYEAVLGDGRRIDLLTGGPVTRGDSKSMMRLLPNFHWRKLHRNLVNPIRESLRQPLANYMVDKWNRENPDDRVSRMRLMYYEQDTGRESLEISNQHAKVWASYQDQQTGRGSLFDQIKDENKNDPLIRGF